MAAACTVSYMDKAALVRLEHHKYQSEGQSLLEPYMQKYVWQRAINYVPLWMAPNLITIIGLFMNISSALLLAFFNPTFEPNDNVPWWAFALCAVGLFMYQLLDALDGKQARRTGNATPLGELFDHGCDAFSTIFVTVGIAGTLQPGAWLALISLLWGMVTYYTAHWRTFVTGKLFFGTLDVTEIQWCIIVAHTCAALFGPAIWAYPVLGLEIRHWFIFASYAGSLKAVLGNIGRCLEGGIGPEGTTVAESSVVAPGIPLVLAILAGLYLTSFDCWESAPLLVLLTVGLMCSKVCIKVVVAHMSKSHLDMTDPTLTFFLIFWANGAFGIGLSTTLMLLLVLSLVLWDVCFYCTDVVRSICQHLRISCFTIPPPKADKAD